MHKDIAFNEYAQEVITQLANGGAFLTVKDPGQNRANIMTIVGNHRLHMAQTHLHGDGPLFPAYLRLIGNRRIYRQCPLKSRPPQRTVDLWTAVRPDLDKFKECGFTPEKGKTVDTPIIKECPCTPECRVVYQQAMEPGQLSPELRSSCYHNPGLSCPLLR